MISLPVTATATRTSGGASVAAEPGFDTSIATGETPAGEAGFLALLGSKLPSGQQLADAGQAAPLPAQPGAAGHADRTPAARARLNDLLARQDEPEALKALLQPADSAPKTHDDDAEPASVLNASELQTMQALFAMLPPALQQSVAVSAKPAEEVTDRGALAGKPSALTAPLSAGEEIPGDDVRVQSKADGIAFPALKESGKTTSASPALNGAFQQAISQINGNPEKENSSSPPAATITNTVISAASSLITPSTLVAAPASAALGAQLGSQEWQQALGQQILMFSKNGQQSAELHLHPQDLGSIQISLKLDNDQAQLSMVSNHSQVRAALEAAMPQLRTALAENGINLGQSHVSSDAFQQGQSFSGQQQQRHHAGGQTFSLASEAEATAVAVPASLQARAAGSHAVDIFA